MLEALTASWDGTLQLAKAWASQLLHVFLAGVWSGCRTWSWGHGLGNEGRTKWAYAWGEGKKEMWSVGASSRGKVGE